MIKAIIFDLGRVLVDIDITQGLLGSMGVTDPASIGRLAENESFVRLSTGRIDPEEFYRAVVAEFELAYDFEEFSRLWCNIFSRIDGMERLVAGLAERYRLGLLSDTDPLHWEYILQGNKWIEEYFPRPVLSFRAGVMKPDPKAFCYAVESVGMKPEECLFIDDLQRNVDGAREFGLNAILFQGRDKLLESLSEAEIII